MRLTKSSLAWQGAACLTAVIVILFLVSRAKSPRQEQRVLKTQGTAMSDKVHGRVLSDGKPVRNATVRWKGTSIQTKSDAQGKFALSRIESTGESAREAARITASKAGFYIGGEEASSLVTIEMKPLPSKDFTDYLWVDPTPDEDSPDNCGNCHREIYEEWNHSAHARSGSGRRFKNLIHGTDWHHNPDVGWNLSKEHPHGVDVCDACHSPTNNESQRAIGGLAADDVHQHAPIDESVHCDFCHKIRELFDAETLGITHGRFGYELLRPEHEQLFFGPLDDVDRGDDVHSPFQHKSEACAPCHEGVVFGVPVYTTYSEWQESPAAKQELQCQDCHMTPTGAMTNVAPDHGGIERDPATLASHRFLPNGIEEMLKHCLSLKLETNRQADRVQINVTVRASNVGHRVPTGFIDRHLVLLIEALDASGNRVLARSGPTLPAAAGKLSARSGYLFAKLLTDGSQPESKQEPQPFWRAGMTITDTRLKPDQAETFEFEFPSTTKQVNAQLLYRKFWEQVSTDKRWPADEIIVTSTGQQVETQGR